MLVALGLSILAGRWLRKSLIEAAAIGLLILCGCANLALTVSQALLLPTWLFGLLAALISTVTVFLLRRFVIAGYGASSSVDWFFVTATTPPLIAFYITNIIQPDPSADLASMQAWPVLYAQKAFSQGHFFDVSKTTIGDGHLASLNYYLDLFGATVLARWFGMEAPYPAYHAVSMLAAMLGFQILALSFKRHRVALVLFSLVTLAFLRHDDFYRLWLGYNWFEVLIYLGGAQIIYYSAKGHGRNDALVMAAIVSVFLVFSRHYGAFYSTFILIFAWLLFVDRRRNLFQKALQPRWMVLGLLLTTFSLRELYYLAFPPNPFYPGMSQLVTRSRPFLESLYGALSDIGVLTNGQLPETGVGLRSLYLVAFIALIWFHREKWLRNRWRLVIYLAPLCVFALPFLLQLVSGYRTSLHYRKPFALGIFLPSWYVCFVVERLLPNQTVKQLLARRCRTLVVGLTVLMLATAVLVFPRIKHHRIFSGDMDAYLSWAFQTYKDANNDLKIAEALVDSGQAERVKESPLLYFHYEPGISVRMFLGGRFFGDFDFWSDTVAEKFASAGSLQGLIRELGDPNVYISYGTGLTYGTYFDNGWRKYEAEIRALDQATWIEQVVKYKHAKLYIVKKQ